MNHETQLPDVGIRDRSVRACPVTEKSRRRHAQLTPKSQLLHRVKVRRATT